MSLSAGNKICFRLKSRRTNGLHARWAVRIIVWSLCGFANFASAQTQTSDRITAQSSNAIPEIRAESRLVLVRVMVADKKAWRNGPSEAGKRCALATEETFLRLPATEPYIPTDCEGLYIRGLTAKDFHLLVDGVEQRIQSVTSESEGLRVRDNQGLHHEFSQTPAGKWSTTDGRIPHYIIQGLEEYGFLARNRYDLSFVPKSSDAPGCHEIKVNVDRRNSIVAAREQYCDRESPSDILNGSTFGDQLERDLTSGQPGEIPLAIQTAAFARDKGRSRVQIALGFPLDSLHREWSQDWTLHATIGVLGMVYRRDGTLASRFSDFTGYRPYATGAVLGMRGTTISRFTNLTEQFGVPSNFASMILPHFEKGTLPTRYETHIDLPPDEYDLRIVLSDGEKFGLAEVHLNIENYDGKGFALSSLMLSKRFRDAHVAATEASAANFAPQYVPLVSKGMQVTPAGDTDFKTEEPLIPYFEIYVPHAAGEPTTQIQVHLRIVDAKNSAIVKDFPSVDVAPYSLPVRTTVPIAREVPIPTLSKGPYRLEVQATDSAGRTTPWRTASFTITDKK